MQATRAIPQTISSRRSAPQIVSRAAGKHVLDMVAWGVPFRLVARSGELLERMRMEAPYGSVESRGASSPTRQFAIERTGRVARYRIVADGEKDAHGATLHHVLAKLRARLIVHVAEYAPDLVFVHAGVAAWRDRALVLPGFSQTGKSTLIAELIRAGATYYSDEFALLDCAGKVHPFPRELHLRLPGQSGKRPVPVSDLAGSTGAAPLSAAMVVFTHFQEGAKWHPETLTPGRAVLEALLHTSPVRRAPMRALAALTAMMRGATAWRTARGEAAEAARALLAALAAEGSFA